MMDNKSIEILSSLKKHLERGSLKAEAFPQRDVMDMIETEYTEWMAEKFQQMKEYLRLYDIVMEDCITKGKYTELSGILDEFIYDLQRTPIEALDRLNGLYKAVENIQEEVLIQNARIMYERYPYQSTLGKNAFQVKGVVYTLITGDYDVIKEPKVVDY